MLQKFRDKMPFKDVLRNTLHWFEKAVPSPTRQNFNTQLGVHFEEIGELLDEVSPQTKLGENLVDTANKAVKDLAHWLKKNSNGVVILPENRKAFLDALCDQAVTLTGTGYMIGMDIGAALDHQVNPSNFSKFDEDTGEPFFDENMKVMKGPAYIKADLSSFV